MTTNSARVSLLVLAVVAIAFSQCAYAHNVSSSNANYLASVEGPAVALFIYLGAKHMVTGVDHLLYLLAVVFLAFRVRDIVALVSLFALGHSITLILGVWLSVQVNPSLVDGIIGFSIAYKAYENLGGFKALNPYVVPAGVAVFTFGLVHGLGLATKLQAVYSGGDGLLVNLIAFNVGVELGQLLALAALLAVLAVLRRQSSFRYWSQGLNLTLLVCGFMFAGFHWFDLVLRGN